MKDATDVIEIKVKQITDRVDFLFRSRGIRATNELMNAKNLVLRGRRNGKRYRVPGTKRYYTASAPSEPPAVRTGRYRMSWTEKSYSDSSAVGSLVHITIESRVKTDNEKYLLGAILENGSSKTAPRPHFELIINRAKPKIQKIFKESYT